MQDLTPSRHRRAAALLLSLALVSSATIAGDFGQAPAPAFRPDARSVQVALGRAEHVARGVDLFRLADPALLSPPGLVAVQLLRLDPRRVTLRSALATDEVLGLETVADTARRHNAIAAVNAGFFLPSGDPAGLLKIGGHLASDTVLHRGAVAIDVDPRRGTSLVFDRVSVSLRLHIDTTPVETTVAVDAIDAARPAGTLVWFDPRFFDHTDTRTAGIDWIVRGPHLHVVERRDEAMRTRIPRDGAVLSFGGRVAPPPLDRLRPGVAVDLEPIYATEFGTPVEKMATSSDIVGGAGLLMRDGRPITDWKVEGLRKGFDEERHPRTMIGVGKDGMIWLITVDGRNEKLSFGMNFTELQRLAEALHLRDALNLDGGGSTTMVVRGRIANHPSDAAGPRKVSDSLLVFAR
jgi:exopolysaccharide biosynthesis protein